MSNIVGDVLLIAEGSIFIVFRVPISDSLIEAGTSIYGRHYAKFAEKTKQKALGYWFFTAAGLLLVIAGVFSLLGRRL